MKRGQQTAWQITGLHFLVAALLASSGSLTDLAAQATQQKPPEQQEQKGQPQEMPAPLPKGKKLFLKDGNFQIVREYEQKGERVRYYSLERSAWEEIPTDLVDWEATRKGEAEEARRQQEIVEKIRATQTAERVADLDVGASIEVAPGVFLPEGEGVFVVEGRSVVPLGQSSAGVKLDKGRLLTQVLVPIPIVPTRQRVQIPGQRAQLRLTTSQPEFYMRTADAREPQMELIHAQVKGDARLIELLSTQVTGQRSSKRAAISMERWKVARGVYRYTLSQPLAPGEYALAEILPEGMNLYVWDFGVDAAAPAAPQRAPARPPQKPSGQAKPKQ